MTEARPAKPSRSVQPRAGWTLLGLLLTSLAVITSASAASDPSLIEKGYYIARLADLFDLVALAMRVSHA